MSRLENLMQLGDNCHKKLSWDVLQRQLMENRVASAVFHQLALQDIPGKLCVTVVAQSKCPVQVFPSLLIYSYL